MTADNALYTAISLHQAGRLVEAAEQYLLVLADRSTHPVANHNVAAAMRVSRRLLQRAGHAAAEPIGLSGPRR